MDGVYEKLIKCCAAVNSRVCSMHGEEGHKLLISKFRISNNYTGV